MINAPSSMNIYQVLLLILVLLQALTCSVRSSRRCMTSSCGDIHNISYPFQLKKDRKRCGDSIYELACEDDRTVVYIIGSRYYVQSIDYNTNQIIVVDEGLQKDNCLSLPHHSWSRYDFNRGSYINNPYTIPEASSSLVIVNCSKPVSSPLYFATDSCIKGLYSSNTSSNWKLYALVNPKASDVRNFCTVSSWTWASDDFGGGPVNDSSFNYKQIYNIVTDGFALEYYPFGLEKTFFCYFDFYYYFHFYNLFYSRRLSNSVTRGQVCEFKPYFGGVLDDIAFWTTWDITTLLVLFCVVKFIIGMPLLVIFLIYKYRRRHLAMDKNIEEFLQAHNNFLPIRYSYSNIKKITKNFKHKLGEGGYGFVYKGMFKSGKEVAIKILKQSKAHDRDFISEVATIGRIHHVNIVQLLGFCFEGSKQALVYDLMSNGSLDKLIFTKEGDKFLDYKKIYEIALGGGEGD